MRVHSECLTGDVFASKRCDCGAQLDLALEMIAAEGRGWWSTCAATRDGASAWWRRYGPIAYRTAVWIRWTPIFSSAILLTRATIALACKYCRTSGGRDETTDQQSRQASSDRSSRTRHRRIRPFVNAADCREHSLVAHEAESHGTPPAHPRPATRLVGGLSPPPFMSVRRSLRAAMMPNGPRWNSPSRREHVVILADESRMS